jgi:hypothetical protein
MQEFALLALVGCLAIAVGALAYWFRLKAERARRDEMASVAARLGLHFLPERDKRLPREFGVLDRLAQGHDRYASNVVSGCYDGHQVLLFDYHYTTGSGKSRKEHEISFFILFLPRPCPELTIRPAGIFARLAGALGWSDINFESAEFARAFQVRSPDRKFAYDICHPAMMQFLLENRDLNMEIEKRVLALAFDRRLNPPEIVLNLTRLLQLRALFPKYLFP